MAELQIVRPSGDGHPVTYANRSFEQERREVLESVLGSLSSALPDADEMAACSYLLQHLATVGNRVA